MSHMNKNCSWLVERKPKLSLLRLLFSVTCWCLVQFWNPVYDTSWVIGESPRWIANGSLSVPISCLLWFLAWKVLLERNEWISFLCEFELYSIMHISHTGNVIHPLMNISWFWPFVIRINTAVNTGVQMSLLL